METGIGNAPAVTDAVHDACVGEAREHDAFVADAQAGAELGTSKRAIGLCESREDGCVEAGLVVLASGVGRALGGLGDLQMHVVVAGEYEPQGLGRRRTAMFDREA